MLNSRRLCLLLAVLLCCLPACDSGTADDDRTGAAARAIVDDGGFQGTVDRLDLEQLRGRVVILNFWATWCTPCRIEIPELIRLRQDFSPEQLTIIGVSLDSRGNRMELAALVEGFVQRNGINYPVYLDPEQAFADPYDPGLNGGIRFVPTTVVLDQQGRVHATHAGLPRSENGRVEPYEVLAEEVQALLTGGA